MTPIRLCSRHSPRILGSRSVCPSCGTGYGARVKPTPPRQGGEGSTAVAYIHMDDPLGRVMFIGDRHDNVLIQIRADGEVTRRDLTDNAAPLNSIEPTARVTEAQARALLDALSRYFDGSDDTRFIRAQLTKEQGRVDRMLDALLATASRTPIVVPTEWKP